MAYAVLYIDTDKRVLIRIQSVGHILPPVTKRISSAMDVDQNR